LKTYAAAIANAHVRFVVNLSSIGAQHANHTGPIVGLHNQEQKLDRVPIRKHIRKITLTPGVAEGKQVFYAAV
jgi:hypothetical protein